MSSLLHSSDQALIITSPLDLFLRHRLQVVEDLWESVLRQECGQALVDLLKQLRALCSPEGQATNDQAAEVVRLIEQLDLNEAIRAARAFALYFQLINIVEQHYEQRQQLIRSLRHRIPTHKLSAPSLPLCTDLELQSEPLKGTMGADLLEKKLAS